VKAEEPLYRAQIGFQCATYNQPIMLLLVMATACPVITVSRLGIDRIRKG
jgi:hypothetical protein